MKIYVYVGAHILLYYDMLGKCHDFTVLSNAENSVCQNLTACEYNEYQDYYSTND